jgi:myo-inositol-1(or 4)-monophosphatase
MALAWVASGQRAAYVTDGDVRDSVHFAAGLAICEGAGCRVTDLRGNPWGNGATGLVASADSQTHEELLRLIGKFLN